uniref:Calcium-transporting ATPase n=1 Tax=Nelumbo nucifera TaxID=4432 RepID=A0A822ZTT4_NELNU|nr:TPA_asm: hypothetical protein HUJ06_017897 [Nelumbo nucifera]
MEESRVRTRKGKEKPLSVDRRRNSKQRPLRRRDGKIVWPRDGKEQSWMDRHRSGKSKREITRQLRDELRLESSFSFAPLCAEPNDEDEEEEEEEEEEEPYEHEEAPLLSGIPLSSSEISLYPKPNNDEDHSEPSYHADRQDQLLSGVSTTESYISLPAETNHDSRYEQEQPLIGTSRSSSEIFLSTGTSSSSSSSSPESQSRHLLEGISSLPSQVSINIDDHGCDGLRFSDVDQPTLIEIVKQKDLDLLKQHYGGVEGVVLALASDAVSGIHGCAADVESRRVVFGSNKQPPPSPKGLFHFFLETFTDSSNAISLASACLSLGFGIKAHGLKEGWYDGGSVLFAVFLVVALSMASNFRLSRQLERSSTLSNIRVEVVRDGCRRSVPFVDMVVGDVVSLKFGDQILADGLFLDGCSLQVNESSITGKSHDHVQVNCSKNPFLLSGTTVVEGSGRMLVISVGTNTGCGQMMMNSVSMSHYRNERSHQTPLQERVNKLTSSLSKFFLAIPFLSLVGILMLDLVRNTEDDGCNSKTNNLINELSSIRGFVSVNATVAIVVVAIPEGLPLLIKNTLAHSMDRMRGNKDHRKKIMVQKLSAIEDMGSVTTICTNAIGTLTSNTMTVAEFWLGGEAMDDSSLHFDKVAPNVIELLRQGIGLNVVAEVLRVRATSRTCQYLYGSPANKAILSWAMFKLGMSEEYLIRQKIYDKKTFGIHWNEDAKEIIKSLSSYYEKNGTIQPMDEGKRMELEQIIEAMASNGLQRVAFIHKQIPDLEDQDEMVGHKLQAEGPALLGLVGLKYNCPHEVTKAVKACRDAGVGVKLITREDVFTAKVIARDCGILEPDEKLNDETVVEGVEFRKYSPEEMMDKVDRIRVMARSSPSDKLLMVRCLKQKGHVVAVTGDDKNDAPALAEADIGLTMGIEGIQMENESSNIIILNGDFASIKEGLRWGRCIFNNIQKFLQFQLTVNVVALAINFVTAISCGEVPLTAVQLLWVNLIMDIFGALALATDQPTNDLMKKSPFGRTKPLISNIMKRNLIAQVLFQVTILLTLHLKGRYIFGVSEKIKETLVFNTFVLCQIFNLFNARNLENRNIFKGIEKNEWFLVVVGITLVLQVVMVETVNKFANTERLNWGQWSACIGIAILSWPIGWIVKCLPVSAEVVNGNLGRVDWIHSVPLVNHSRRHLKRK